MTTDIIVIGGGHNGLTAAGLLAKSGRKVVLLERANFLGGVAAGIELTPGYRVPSLLHETGSVDRRVIEELSLHSHGLSLRSADPPVFSPGPKGDPGVLLGAGEEESGLSDGDRAQLRKFRSFLERVGEALSPVFHRFAPDIESLGWGDLVGLAKSGLSLRRLGREDLEDFLRAGPMCVADWLNEWFESDRLKAMLAGVAIRGTFTGPWSPGSALQLFYQAARREHAGVSGGGEVLVRALEKSAVAHGVEVQTGAEVERIKVSRGAVTGVTLTSGESFGADLVLCCCDPKRAVLGLLNPVDVPVEFGEEVGNIRTRGTTAKLHLALKAPLEFSSRPGESFERVRIGDHVDDIERAFDAAKYGESSKRPHLDLWIPTVSDPTLAPRGHHVVSILIHYAPYFRKGGWDEKARETLESAAMKRLEEVAPGVGSKVVGSELLTPRDLEERYGLTEGHIDHGEHALDQLVFLRPCSTCRRSATPVDGLFLGSSGTHPGGGISGTPGYLAARSILVR